MPDDPMDHLTRLDLTPDRWLSELGAVLTVVSPEEVAVRVEVDARVTGQDGAVHPGAYSSMIESTASFGAALWFRGRGQVVGVHNVTEVLVPVRSGTVTVRATPLHRADDQQLWNATATDGAGTLVACGQVRLQNLPDA